MTSREPIWEAARDARIERIRLRRLLTPLERPYVSSLGITAELASILVEITLDDGATGFSEVTPIAGYCKETADDVWRFSEMHAPTLIGEWPAVVLDRLVSYHSSQPYACSPLVAALELTQPRSGDSGAVRDRIRVAAAVLSDDDATIRSEVESLLAAGFRTLKVKAGMDPESDRRRLRALRDQARNRAQVRIDFNGALDYDRAMRWLDGVAPSGIEYIEQPCSAGDWTGSRRVAAHAGIPVALDESVTGPDDIRRMADIGVFGFFKLKLGKFPSIASLHRALDLGQSAGMRGVIGNGAATDVACWIEACVAAEHDLPAGEMNGFSKNVVNYLATPLRIDGGMLVVEAQGRPTLDWKRVEARSRDRLDIC